MIGSGNLMDHLSEEALLDPESNNSMFNEFLATLSIRNKRTMEKLLKSYIIEPKEICPDFTNRNVIHDILDFDNPLKVENFLKQILKHEVSLSPHSSLAKEVLMGLLHRLLGSIDLPEYTGFFDD
jgi:hypothetical protein